MKEFPLPDTVESTLLKMVQDSGAGHGAAALRNGDGDVVELHICAVGESARLLHKFVEALTDTWERPSDMERAGLADIEKVLQDQSISEVERVARIHDIIHLARQEGDEVAEAPGA